MQKQSKNWPGVQYPLKIRRREGVESLTTFEEGEFKESIDGCINFQMHWISFTWHFSSKL